MFPFNKSYFPKQKFVFALSGGIDSIAACKFLKQGNYDFIAAHFNHKFIPQDDEIAESVTRFCYKNEIPLFVIESNKKSIFESEDQVLIIHSICDIILFYMVFRYISNMFSHTKQNIIIAITSFIKYI